MAVDEIVRKRSRAQARLYDDFIRAQEPTAGFYPDDHRGSGDYNMHYVLLEADPEAEWAFSQLGLAVSRGDHDHELDAIIAKGAAGIQSA